MIPWDQLLPAWAACAALMAALWAVQLRTRDAGIVDVGWTVGIGGLAVLAAARGDGDPVRRAVLASIAGLWSLRLAAHLLHDRVVGKEEDGRYAELRTRWGAGAQRNFFLFFQAQALLDVVLSIPFLVVAANRAPAPSWREAAAIGLAAIAIGGEWLADRQLAAWRRDPAHRGLTCREGLWRYSRHPNYFFEWVHWWAYVPLAAGSAWEGGAFLALLGPVLMLLLVVKVTGIPPTEARALRTRGDDYRRYQRETSAFLPWFPKESPTPR